jgi:O-antigen/teichoic acid export membrane protein
MLKAINRPRVEMYAAGLGLAVNLLLNVLLIPVLGIVGAAVATVVGYVMFNLVEVVVIYRLVGTHPFSANSLQPLTVTALVGIGVALFVGKSRLGFLSLVGIGILLVVVQAGAVWGTRSFDETDRVLIEQTKRRLGFD